MVTARGFLGVVLSFHVAAGLVAAQVSVSPVSITPMIGGGYSVPGINSNAGPIASSPGLGPTIGGTAQFAVTEKLIFDLGVFYATRKHENWKFGMSTTQRLQQFLIPAQIRFQMDPRVSVGAGAYTAIGIGPVLSSNIASGTFDDPTYRNSDYGLIFSMTMDIPLDEGWALVAEGQYLYGLQDIDNSSDAEFMFRDMRALLGVRMTL